MTIALAAAGVLFGIAILGLMVADIYLTIMAKIPEWDDINAIPRMK